MATTDYLLKIEGVQGESKQEGYADHIDLDSWSWGMSNSGSAAQGGGLGTAKASAQDFHFVIRNGKSSPQLFYFCSTGKVIPTATLICRKSTGDTSTGEYYRVIFNECLISSHQQGGSGGSNMLPMEQVSFNYAKVTVEYHEQKEDGSLGGIASTHSYDVKLGKAA